MKHRSKLACVAGLLLAGFAFGSSANADCVYPKAPASIPDGNTATEPEMVEGMRSLKEYDSAVTAYLNCLDMETTARISEAGPDATSDQVKQIRAMEAKKHNAAVDELQSHAEEFNKQVRTFKTRKKG